MSKDHETNDLVNPAIIKTTEWSSQNSMILNTDNTLVLKTCFSYKYNYESNISINDIALSPSTETMFLGAIIDD